ncbi:hypothetical protein D3C87_2078790 [compost metagenome]
MFFMHSGTGAFTFGGRMLQRRARRLLFGIPLALVVGIVAAINTQACTTEFQNARHLRQ